MPKNKIKELVILDLDNVIIKGQSQKYFLDYLFKKGHINSFFYFRIYLWFLLYKLGLVKNPKNIMEYAFSSLKEVNIDKAKKIVSNFFNENLNKFIFKEMVAIIEEHRNKNRELIIVSNAIDIIVKKIAEYLNIKNYIGTKLEIKKNKFTGKILGDIVYGKNKKYLVQNFIIKNNLIIKNSWAYADHISDLDLLLFVDYPFIVNPDNLLCEEAKKRNWDILIFNI